MCAHLLMALLLRAKITELDSGGTNCTIASIAMIDHANTDFFISLPQLRQRGNDIFLQSILECRSTGYPTIMESSVTHTV